MTEACVNMRYNKACRQMRLQAFGLVDSSYFNGFKIRFQHITERSHLFRLVSMELSEGRPNQCLRIAE